MINPIEERAVLGHLAYDGALVSYLDDKGMMAIDSFLSPVLGK
jgi:hypothetical protein